MCSESLAKHYWLLDNTGTCCLGTNLLEMAMPEIVQEPERALKLVKSELNYAYDIHSLPLANS